MVFNPDEWLLESEGAPTATLEEEPEPTFDPDAYLSDFDPDVYLGIEPEKKPGLWEKVKGLTGKVVQKGKEFLEAGFGGPADVPVPATAYEETFAPSVDFSPDEYLAQMESVEPLEFPAGFEGMTKEEQEAVLAHKPAEPFPEITVEDKKAIVDNLLEQGKESMAGDFIQKTASAGAGAAAMIPGLKSALGRDLSLSPQAQKLIEEEPAAYATGAITSAAAQILSTGPGVANVLKGTRLAKSPTLLNAMTRGVSAGIHRGGLEGEKVAWGQTDIKSALYNTVIESAGGAAFSVVPEVLLPANAIQLIGQPLFGLMYQGTIDKASGKKFYNVDGKEVGILSKEWFMEQLPTIAADLGFAIRDVSSGQTFRMEQGAQRAEIKGWLKGKGSKGFKIEEIEGKPVIGGKKAAGERIKKAVDTMLEEAGIGGKAKAETPIKEAEIKPGETNIKGGKQFEGYKPTAEEAAKLPEPTPEELKAMEEIAKAPEAPAKGEAPEAPRHTYEDLQKAGLTDEQIEILYPGMTEGKAVKPKKPTPKKTDIEKIAKAEKELEKEYEQFEIQAATRRQKLATETEEVDFATKLRSRLTTEKATRVVKKGKQAGATYETTVPTRALTEEDWASISGESTVPRSAELDKKLSKIAENYNLAKREGEGVTTEDVPPARILNSIDNWSADDVADLLGKGFQHKTQYAEWKKGIKARESELEEQREIFEEEMGRRGEALGGKAIELGVEPDMFKGDKVFASPDRVPSEMGSVEPRDPVSPDTPIRHELPVSLKDKLQGKGKPLGAHKVIKKMSEIADAPIRVGRIRKKKAGGVFKVEPEVIRIKVANDIPTATHETAHAIHKQLVPLVNANDKAFQKLWRRNSRDLVNLGKQLYGTTKPVGGYASEGFAEYLRYKLTTDEAAKRAPKFDKFFEENILKNSPELKKQLDELKGMIDEYKGQGAQKRIESHIEYGEAGPGIFKKIKSFFSSDQHLDEFDPFYKFTKAVEEATGEKGKITENPFLSATVLKYTHDSRTYEMVTDGMMDWAGSKVGPSLNEATAIVKGKRREFTAYLYARRALERWSKGKNPGISQKDAQYLLENTETPEFQLAANKIYEWQRGVLNYITQADPTLKPLVEKILKGSSDYIPLARVFEDVDPRTARRLMRKGGAGLLRMKGSGRRIRDPFQVMIENTSNLISMAHKRYVTKQLLRWRDVPGIGKFIEEVPKDMVPHSGKLEDIKSQLEKAGADLTEADLDEIITFFSPASQPKGVDPIVPLRVDNKIKWFEVDAGLYNTLQGMDVYRLPKALDLLLGAPTRGFKLFTTGMRPVFSLVRNPLKDVQTFLFQTHSKANPLKAAQTVAKTYATVGGELVGLKKNPYKELYERLGGRMSQQLGIDTRHTRRAVKQLFEGKIARIVKHPIDHLRNFLEIPETATRAAEVELIANEVGWKPGEPITLEQSMEILLKAKRVTTDFGAAGKLGKIINQCVPYYNANLQGPRTFIRTFKRNPMAASLKGIMAFTIPTLILWWANKDKKWYKDMTWRDKFGYWNIEFEDEVVRIPRAYDVGNAFSVLPEAIVDSWYQQDPKAAKEALGHILETSTPDLTPQTLRPVAEQLANKEFFSGRPIVSVADMRRPYDEQYGPYTSKLAIWLGKELKMSPNRIDHLVRAYGGGLSTDIINVVGLGGAGRGKREMEPSDIPVVGTLFRRGGKHGYSQAVQDMYDEYNKAAREFSSKDVMRKYDSTTVNKYYNLESAVTTIRILKDLELTKEFREDRNKIRIKIQKIAEDALGRIKD